MTLSYSPKPVPVDFSLDSVEAGEQIRILRSMLAEAAHVIMRCIGEDAEFDGDVEQYAGALLEAADMITEPH